MFWLLLLAAAAVAAAAAGCHPGTMFWLLLLAAAAIAVVRYRLRRRAMYKAHDEMPFGIPSYPIIGHAYLFRGTDEDRMNSLKRIGRIALQHRGFTSFWLGSKLYTVIAEPRALELVAKACLEKDEATMKFIRLVLGNGMVFAPVKIWRHRRKVMAPTFSAKNLQQFVAVFDKQSLAMVRGLRARAGAGDFSIWPHITTYTFDSICETVMGIELKSQERLQHPFITAIDELTRILATRILSPWLYWDWVFRLTPLYKQFMKQRQWGYDFFDKVLRDKRRRLAANQAVDRDSLSTKSFLDMMVESSGGAKGYSDIELREEVLAVVTAGTDTSAVGTAFTVLMLSMYPRVQDKVYKELQEVFGDSERPVTWEDLPKLRYLEVVIKETLRLYPPAPVVVRDVQETIVLPSGTALAAGTAAALHLWAAHRHADYWGADAELFRPERFLEGPLKHPAQFVPFGCSPRNCLGYNYGLMSTKTSVANLLRWYRLLPPAAAAAAAPAPAASAAPAPAADAAAAAAPADAAAAAAPADAAAAATLADADRHAQPLRIKFDIVMRHCDNFEVQIVYREKPENKE